MSNNSGILFGQVKRPDRSGVSGAEVTINWLTKDGAGAVRIGEDPELHYPPPRVVTTTMGEYVLPFYWHSNDYPGPVASALAIKWYSDGSSKSVNSRGNVVVGPDVRQIILQIISQMTPTIPFPSDSKDVANMFLSFYQTASPELKGLPLLSKFLGSRQMSAALRGIFCRIDFEWPY